MVHATSTTLDLGVCSFLANAARAAKEKDWVEKADPEWVGLELVVWSMKPGIVGTIHHVVGTDCET